MSNPKIEIEEINGIEIKLYYFNNPMFHEDWHKAEEMGLVYSHYCHFGPDYWDDNLCFCIKSQKELVEKWREENQGW